MRLARLASGVCLPKASLAITVKGQTDDQGAGIQIVGPARYRLSLGFSLRGLHVDSAALPVLRCLREQPATLQELADATALGPDGARRLLNALYLQSGLMVTRSLPTRWFGRG